MSISVSGSQVTFNDGSTQNTSAYGGGFAMRNRLINGAMMIDQRNAGASVTPANFAYTLDRWQAVQLVASKFSVQQNAGSVTPPAGYRTYLGITSLSAYSVGAGEIFSINQNIEGFNTADLMFGTANAATFTFSFWVRSSLTGTFGGSFANGANDRSYPFSYTISSANTWEQKTITVAGDTTGTWIGATNGNGLVVRFGLGGGSTFSGTAGSWASANYYTATGATSVVGTNGATFYITGVQLEKGSTATSFDYRPYGTELQLCQRYYYRLTPGASGIPFNGVGVAQGSTQLYATMQFPVPMRVAPSALEQDGVAADYQIYNGAGSTNCNSVPTFANASTLTCLVGFGTASGLTTGQIGLPRPTNSTAYLGWSAEL